MKFAEFVYTICFIEKLFLNRRKAGLQYLEFYNLHFANRHANASGLLWKCKVSTSCTCRKVILKLRTKMMLVNVKKQMASQIVSAARYISALVYICFDTD